MGHPGARHGPILASGEDVLAHLHFPAEHRRQLHSTNTLERLNKEIKRRTNVVGIFLNEQAVLRLVGAILAEQLDEWAVGRRYFSQESMAKLTQPSPPGADVPLLPGEAHPRTLQGDAGVVG